MDIEYFQKVIGENPVKVVFDIDGVLADQIPVFKQIIQSWADPMIEESQKAKIIENGFNDYRLKNSGMTTAQIDQLISEYHQRLLDVPAMTEVLAALTRLRNTGSNCPWITPLIATQRPGNTVQDTLQWLDNNGASDIALEFCHTPIEKAAMACGPNGGIIIDDNIDVILSLARIKMPIRFNGRAPVNAPPDAQNRGLDLTRELFPELSQGLSEDAYQTIQKNAHPNGIGAIGILMATSYNYPIDEKDEKNEAHENPQSNAMRPSHSVPCGHRKPPNNRSRNQPQSAHEIASKLIQTGFVPIVCHSKDTFNKILHESITALYLAILNTWFNLAWANRNDLPGLQFPSQK